ncbi:hypothetical protein SBOR_3848 [Sclerotinia borealis F-4128]|uniref:Transcription initiation factor TFIID subunit 13 n=1 Tax=Sclerotinia borealis (strain F-4128) TaxID=1432307 RepID=W9CIP2_SCLBF|nr:hypothetical protein SBOR_3848 [Sclerotinia borealis F-4128]
MDETTGKTLLGETVPHWVFINHGSEGPTSSTTLYQRFPSLPEWLYHHERRTKVFLTAIDLCPREPTGPVVNCKDNWKCDVLLLSRVSKIKVENIPIDVRYPCTDARFIAPYFDPARKMSEPRARAAKNRGQQNFSEAELRHFLHAHGDVKFAIENTTKALDEIVTDFIIELCFEASRAAQIAGRQKVKLDDIKFACRKNPTFLGKITEVFEKKSFIDEAKKTFDATDDKVAKSGGKFETLGEEDDDPDAITTVKGGK